MRAACRAASSTLPIDYFKVCNISREIGTWFGLSADKVLTPAEPLPPELLGGERDRSLFGVACLASSAVCCTAEAITGAIACCIIDA